MNLLEATAAITALTILFAADLLLAAPDTIMDLIAFGW
jgi:hypothetical protein